MKTLIIGASTNQDRYSYKAIQKLRKLSYFILLIMDGNTHQIQKNFESKVIGIRLKKLVSVLTGLLAQD